jgi:23S rRNA (adenine2030-N6)-methyltransferase
VAIDRFRADLARSGIPRLLRAELLIRNRAAAGQFNGAGLVICNPPWKFEATLTALLAGLWPRLAEGSGAGKAIDVIAGE